MSTVEVKKMVLSSEEKSQLDKLAQDKSVFELVAYKTGESEVELLRSLAILNTEVRAAFTTFKRADNWSKTSAALFEKRFPGITSAASADDALASYVTGEPLHRSLSWLKRRLRIAAHVSADILLPNAHPKTLGLLEELASAFPLGITQDMLALCMTWTDGAKSPVITIGSTKIGSAADLWTIYFDMCAMTWHKRALDAADSTATARFATNYETKADESQKLADSLRDGTMTMVDGKAVKVPAIPAVVADSEQTDSEQTDSEQTDSEQTDSEQTDSEQTDSEQTDSEQTDSEQTDSEQTDSEQTDSEQTAVNRQRPPIEAREIAYNASFASKSDDDLESIVLTCWDMLGHNDRVELAVHAQILVEFAQGKIA